MTMDEKLDEKSGWEVWMRGVNCARVCLPCTAFCFRSSSLSSPPRCCRICGKEGLVFFHQIRVVGGCCSSYFAKICCCSCSRLSQKKKEKKNWKKMMDLARRSAEWVEPVCGTLLLLVASIDWRKKRVPEEDWLRAPKSQDLPTNKFSNLENRSR